MKRCRNSAASLPVGASLTALLALSGVFAACSSEPVDQPSVLAPDVPHAAPNEAPEVQEICVACHACGSFDAPVIDRGHATCTECHGPPPEYVVTLQGEDPCGFRMDCTVEPPEVNCTTACHRHTVREVNAMCEFCHAYARP